MKRIAIVIDVSGSMHGALDVFSFDEPDGISPVIITTKGSPEPIDFKGLAERYDEVYIFTDGLMFTIDWSLIINPKIHLIKV